MILFIDSGVGGLNVLAKFRKWFPGGNFIYLKDSAFFPYGLKSQAELQKRVEFLSHRIAALPLSGLVISCNTLSLVNARQIFQKKISVPIFDFLTIYQANKDLWDQRDVNILATPLSAKLLSLFFTQANIIACPGLAEALENNLNFDDLLAIILERLNSKKILVGCTHYYKIFDKLPCKSFQIIDPAQCLLEDFKNFNWFREALILSNVPGTIKENDFMLKTLV